MKAEQPECIFRENLRQMVAMAGTSLKEIASKCKLDRTGYKWLRRVASKGLTRATVGNKKYLHSLAKVLGEPFDCSDWKYFWSKELISVCIRKKDAKKRRLQDRGVVRMFEDLLKTQEYPYLAELVVDLYRMRNRGDDS